MLPPAPWSPPSPAALFRFAILSEVRVLVLRGQPLAEAVRELAARQHVGIDGRPCRVSGRTLYRWWRAHKHDGIDGLAPTPRAPIGSRALDPALVAFLCAEKQADPRASIPELLRRAVFVGLLASPADVDRTTVWRALQRLGQRTKLGRAPPKDQRRFAKESRMQIMLCDGKHFRAGRSAARRVALFFIDDASRYVPPEPSPHFDLRCRTHHRARLAPQGHAPKTILAIGESRSRLSHPAGVGQAPVHACSLPLPATPRSS